GRTLAGRWLETRGRARFVQLRSALDPIPELGPGPLFIELEDAAGIDDWELTLESERICVAAPKPPVTDFELVRAPPLDDYLDRLLSFVAARLPNDDHFDPAQA